MGAIPGDVKSMANRAINNRQKVSYRQTPAGSPPAPKSRKGKREDKRKQPPPPVPRLR
jgi:hypothetical protein